MARFAALGVGGFLVLRGEVTAGTLVAFLSYVGGLFGPLQNLSNVYRTARTAGVSLDVLLDVIDAEDQVPDAPHAIESPPLRGEVRFEDVRFGYEEGRSVLEGVDLHVRPGERVAVVGPSGGGKTTMMALLQRLYDPSGGRVSVDGIDVKDVQQRSLRSQIGVVTEEPLLFDDTLENNIRYGKPDASREEVEAAIEAAQLEEVVQKLPAGYETRLGERGSRISAGDRQRVAIARALLKAPPVLVLDDATSALDAECEHRVHGALERLAEGRTTFIVAHRLSTAASADRILVLRDGKIAEDGSHRELMKKGGYYAEMVESRLGCLKKAA
ncbi:MAG: ABC transporter ATP-binding protein [Polyangiaceae bacterium]|nr:ABC transporter ATP-binding protein [Polyangiaceae bacterium]